MLNVKKINRRDQKRQWRKPPRRRVKRQTERVGKGEEHGRTPKRTRTSRTKGQRENSKKQDLRGFVKKEHSVSPDRTQALQLEGLVVELQ